MNDLCSFSHRQKGAWAFPFIKKGFGAELTFISPNRPAVENQKIKCNEPMGNSHFDVN
jgi:hypothetical protein